jgi:uncharacterized delta-60 repeat protein
VLGVVAVAVAGVVGSLAPVGHALPNVLDPTFGAGGRALLPPPQEGPSSVPSVAVASDGSIWFVHHQDDLLHVSSAGVVISQLHLFTAGWVVAAEPDGGVVVLDASANEVILFHLTALGGLDPRFLNGVLHIPGLGASAVDAALVAPDATLLVAASVAPPGRFDLLRIRPDGSLDPRFGSGGVVRAPMIGGPSTITALPGGAFLVADVTGGFLAKFTTDGRPDPSFGTGGVVGRAGAIEDPHVQPDGKLVGGIPQGTSVMPGVRRLLPNGTPDPAFATNGTVTFPVPFDGGTASEVVLRPDGSILALGPGDPGSHVISLFAGLVDTSGNPVTSFATNGFTDQFFPLPTSHPGEPAALHCDDKAVAVIFGDTESVIRVALPPPSSSAGHGGYVLDGAGGLHPFALPGSVAPPPACITTPGFTRFARAWGVALLPNDRGAVVLDVWGGLHPYSTVGTVPTVRGTTSWPGWDIARGLAVTTNNTGGYVLDGWGGVHPFGYGAAPAPPAPRVSAYWSGWDIARSMALLPDNTRGYVLDGFGGLHPLAVAGHAGPPVAHTTGYFPGNDIARSVALLHDGTGGYVLDGWGGLHPFGIGAHAAPPAVNSHAYWPGRDLARSVVILPDDSGGYVLDALGAMHPFAIGAHPLPAPVDGGVYWTPGLATGAALAP